MKLNKNTTLKQILEVKGVEKVLAKHSFPCMGCGMMQFEADFLKIKEVCDVYGIDYNKLSKDLGKLK